MPNYLHLGGNGNNNNDGNGNTSCYSYINLERDIQEIIEKIKETDNKVSSILDTVNNPSNGLYVRVSGLEKSKTFWVKVMTFLATSIAGAAITSVIYILFHR